MKRGFSLVELMIVVAVLGILAAIVVPQFQSHTTEAKIAAAKNNLHILRAAIELYAARHDVGPGYPGNDPTQNPALPSFVLQIVRPESGGRYLSDLPENSFNELKTIEFLANGATFPADATGENGWIYKASTREIRLDWPGTDKKGVRYYDY